MGSAAGGPADRRRVPSLAPPVVVTAIVAIWTFNLLMVFVMPSPDRPFEPLNLIATLLGIPFVGYLWHRRAKARAEHL